MNIPPQPPEYVVIDIETTGLNPVQHKITCICAKTNTGKWFAQSMGNEYQLVQDFIEWIDDIIQHKTLKVITKNGLQFDVPFLCTRACVNSYVAERIGYMVECEHIDLQTLFRSRISMDDMCTLTGIENKRGSGREAIELAQRYLWNDLKEYCKKDVEITEKLYLLFKEKGLIQ